MSDADLIVAKTSVTIDGIPGSEVLAVCNHAGQVTLSCDGQLLADSKDSEDDNLFRLRTARGAAFSALAGLLKELHTSLDAAAGDRKSAGQAAITELQAQLKKV